MKTKKKTEAQKLTTPKSSTGSRRKLWIVGSVSAVCGMLATAVLALGLYEHFLNTYEFKFYPGVHIGSVDLSGLTYLEGVDQVNESVETLQSDGVLVQYDAVADASVHITPTDVPLDSSANERTLFTLDSENSLKAAYDIGRNGSVLDKAKQQWWAKMYGRAIQLNYSFNAATVKSVLQETFVTYETPAVNADIDIASDGTLTISDESAGSVFDYDAITAKIEEHIRTVDSTSIHIATQVAVPAITRGDIQKDATTIEGYLALAPVTLTWEDKTWEFDRASVGGWLSYSSGTLRVDPIALDASLEDAHSSIDVEVKESRWTIDKNEGGALIGIHEMQAATTGQSIDSVATGANILLALQRGESSPSVALSVTSDEPAFTPDTINEIGIHDLLGTGHSNMGNSPTNRRKNIARGVELLNGLLIAPKEDFSLLGALKPFTTENGYYPELVIKGNKTTPEIGGGLCQIGTTTFRGAMGSGLPILKRQNHSYAVSYYSDDRNHQPGTDATIYDPAPDFSFRNDTPGYILLQTRVEGNDLYFDFWGTSDGRVGSFTPPTTSNWIQPPPLKELPTTDLGVGERKCTELAHAGVTADFTYNVEFPDGTKKEQQFHSVYKPWQAVCLVGVAPGDPVLQSSAQ